MSELIFAPSEFAFGYSGCKRCYYDLKNDNIRVSTAFPSIFSKLDRLQKEFYHDKNSDVLNANIEPGKIKTDLAPHVDVNLETMKEDVKKARNGLPYIFCQMKKQIGVEDVAKFLFSSGGL